MQRKNQKDRYWLEVFEQYRASGKSQNTFCMDNNHPYAQFKYYWEKLVQKPKRAHAQQRVTNDFVPVAIQSSSIVNAKTLTSRSTKAIIELPNEVRCTLTIGSGLDDLGTLLKQLVSLC